MFLHIVVFILQQRIPEYEDKLLKYLDVRLGSPRLLVVLFLYVEWHRTHSLQHLNYINYLLLKGTKAIIYFCVLSVTWCKEGKASLHYIKS